jgi:hypothetical protein
MFPPGPDTLSTSVVQDFEGGRENPVGWGGVSNGDGRTDLRRVLPATAAVGRAGGRAGRKALGTSRQRAQYFRNGGDSRRRRSPAAGITELPF